MNSEIKSQHLFVQLFIHIDKNGLIQGRLMPQTHDKTHSKKKDPKIAAIASFFIPGLGQIYNGEIRKGIGFIIIAILFVSLWLFLIEERHMTGPIVVASGACVLFWIGSMYDAYKTAKDLSSMIQQEMPGQRDRSMDLLK